jgi:hypothetical protein
MLAGMACVALLAGMAVAQDTSKRGRKYKSPPVTAHIEVLVQKANGKPLMNAAVIFHPVKDGKDDGNLEMKTDPDGKAAMDLLEVGAHVTVQVIARGFNTFATDFDVTKDGKEILVKLQRPASQVSTYVDNTGKTAVVTPGVQEHVVGKPATGATGSTGTTGTTTPK